MRPIVTRCRACNAAVVLLRVPQAAQMPFDATSSPSGGYICEGGYARRYIPALHYGMRRYRPHSETCALWPAQGECG